MSQQINLLRDGLEGRKVPWSARKLAVVVLALLVVLGLWSVLLQRQLGALKASHVQLRAEIEAGNGELQVLAKALQARAPSPSLPGEIESARQDLDGRRWLLATLRGQSQEGGAVPLSPFLEGLGRQRIDSLWLTAIAIDLGGVELGLRGRVLDPQALPLYLQRLGTEPAFANRDFRLFALERPVAAADKPALPGLDFAVATRCGAPGMEAICSDKDAVP